MVNNNQYQPGIKVVSVKFFTLMSTLTKPGPNKNTYHIPPPLLFLVDWKDGAWSRTLSCLAAQATYFGRGTL